MPDRPTPATDLADDTEYTGLDLSDLVLDGPVAGGRVWRERRFVDCTLHDADLRGLVTERCVFDGCRFRGTDLGDSTHRGSAFRSCTVERTTLSGARFVGCSLLGSTVVRLRGTRLDGADLRGARLDPDALRAARLTGATVDLETALAFAAAHGLRIG